MSGARTLAPVAALLFALSALAPGDRRPRHGVGPPPPAAIERPAAAGVARHEGPAARPRTDGEAPGRRRSAARMPADDGTIRGALRRALWTGAIDRRGYRRYARIERRARAGARRLPGARRSELAAALATVEDLAARSLFTVDRMPAGFLTLRRNTEAWTTRPFPSAGERLTFGRDAAVFQYFPGRGIVLHPLASFGRLNALARVCLERPHADACRGSALRRGLDRLAGLAARRGGFLAWEYLVDYGGGRQPWISGMAQATAIQALARGAQALDEPSWMRIARRAR